MSETVHYRGKIKKVSDNAEEFASTKMNDIFKDKKIHHTTKMR